MTANDEPIMFYSTRSAYKEFSNFYPSGFEIDGICYKTVEHFYQAMKFHDHEMRQVIASAPTASKSKDYAYLRAGRWGTPEDRAFIKELKARCKLNGVVVRPDLDAIKEDIMWNALVYKFTLYPELKQVLVDTYPHPLIEASRFDSYWGYGRDHNGQNRLGVLLMELRQIFVDDKEPALMDI